MRTHTPGTNLFRLGRIEMKEHPDVSAMLLSRIVSDVQNILRRSRAKEAEHENCGALDCMG